MAPGKKTGKRRIGVENIENDVHRQQLRFAPATPADMTERTGTFADELRKFLREHDQDGNERLRFMLEKLCMEDPKAALQFLCSYAFGKPADRLDVSATVAGVPEKFIELFRERAKEL